ncbi:MAG TPA: assimilatory sulfite reductase (NADPH) flavoprotein subunit [Rhizomicrobium sp.]|nr:assimilatory sulfite reductase (NADPH) flavoprotein subunit [Rhizomicrobium sp.]
MPATLTPDQLAQLDVFARTLDRDQALWASGYLAGLAGAGPVPQDDSAPAPAAITILYGSETGNSAGLARDFASRLQAAGVAARAVDMDSYKVRALKEERILLVITSTHGEGDPPQSALNFFEFIEGRKAPRLPGLRFSVLALGDSTYEKYCEAGKRLDRRLEELGATRLAPRIDCDVDYEAPAVQWMTVLEPLLPKNSGPPSAVAARTAVPAAAARFDKRHPFDAPVIENLVLTGRGSSKETRHVELSLAGSGLAYAPGDALGLFARNDAELVEAILNHAGLSGDTPVARNGGETSLAAALTSDFEIVAATPRFLESWAELSDAAALRRLAAPENAAERNAYLHQHHVIDIIRDFPVPGLRAESFVPGLRPLQPRLYSIASSLAAVPDEVHLTVATVRYELRGEPRGGVASGHLSSRAAPDTLLPVYIQDNPHFRLPGDDAPIVMIGAGTGVAPYRAFLQEREARGATGKSWLFFGERNSRSDFLYQLEWQEHLRSGLLTRMDVAFSRDRADKVYVQHRLRERASDLYAWLEEGAHLYVCGDAAHMAPDVHAALLSVLQDEGHLGPEAAEEYLRTLQRDHRYQRDVY